MERMCCCSRMFLNPRKDWKKQRKLTKICQSGVRSITTKENQNQFTVTFDNIFSEGNKLRCRDAMLGGSLFNRDKKLETASKAAVLVPLCTVKGEPSVLFTLRSKTLYDHKGEVSFPGGKMDETDTDLQYTALREAHEEVGLDPKTIDVWGTLSDIPSKNFKSIVTPFVGYCGEVDIDELNHNPHEVEEIFHCTLPHLCDLRYSGSTQFRTDFRMRAGYTMPLYQGPHRIWGLTALILHFTLINIAPGLYKQKVKMNVLKSKTN